MRPGGEVSFEEIARAIGVTPEGARQIYRRALRKLCRNAVELRRMRDLVNAKESGDLFLRLRFRPVCRWPRVTNHKSRLTAH